MDRDPNDLNKASPSNIANSGSGAGPAGAGREPLPGSDRPGPLQPLRSFVDVDRARLDDARDAASEKLEEVRHVATEKLDDVQEAAGEKLELVRDSAKDTLDDAREQLTEGAEKARKWKRTMEQKLAERLHDGASRLRERADNIPAAGSGTPAYAGATAEGVAAADAAVADRAQSVERTIARGMDATAEWIKDGDIQTTVKEQARTNPVRTVLVALGLGYLLGKALKK